MLHSACYANIIKASLLLQLGDIDIYPYLILLLERKWAR